MAGLLEVSRMTRSTLATLALSVASLASAPACRQAAESRREEGAPAAREELGTGAGHVNSRYILTRCGYRVGGRWHHSDNYSFVIALMTAPQAEELVRLSEEVRTLFSQAAAAARVEPGDESEESPPCRSYELSPLESKSQLAELEILDFPAGGPELEVMARLGEREVRLRRELPELSFLLRQGALSVLGTAMGQEHYPQRRPLLWHGAALAEFLHKGVLVYPEAWKERAGPQEHRIVSGVLAELARLRDPQGVSLLVESLLPAVETLADLDVQGLQADERTAVKLLLLTREARKGQRGALQEILSLSLEYGGSVSIFAAAARVLFPAAENPLLYFKYPARPRAQEGEIRFLQEISRRFASLSFEPGRGWKLPEP
jgi:hypothetical protein